MQKTELTWIESCSRLRQAGIPPQAWSNFIAAALREGLILHSAVLGTADELLAEVYLKECGFNPLHRTFSVSKSVTALAIGCLAADGQLSLDDKLLKFYPEYAAEAKPWLAELTIRQMLRMESCHTKTTYKINYADPWLESFFKVEPDHAPGTVFRYDTSASHVLAALAERLSGRKLLDYLRDKGLRAKGFSEDAYFLTDPQGYPIGGSGLMATARDMLLIAQLVLQDGGGVFPPAFCREMTAFQTVTACEQSIPEEGWGYGYQCWRHRRGWVFYGKGGQLVLAVPAQKLILVTMADLQKSKAYVQKLYDLFFAFIADPMRAKQAAGRTEARGEETAAHEAVRAPELCLPQLRQTEERAFPALDLGQKNKQTEIALAYNGKRDGCIRLRKGDEHLELSFRLGAQLEQRLGKRGQRAFVSAAVSGPRQLQVWAQVVDEEVGFIEALIGRSEKAVTLQLKNNMEQGFGAAEGFWSFPLSVGKGDQE